MSNIWNASLSHALSLQADQGTAQLQLQAESIQSMCGEQDDKQ